MNSRKTYIEKLVEQGEHQMQDFKFEISDSKKIARSISAFANTHGGKLLVGIKDNGAIAGIRSEEEFHMLQAAAQLYCKPEVPLKFKEWNVLGKQVLEVDIIKTTQELISAPDKNGAFKIFVRYQDQNILANGIFIKAWQQKKDAREVELKYTEEEKNFLQIISNHQPINWSQIKKRLNCKSIKLNQMILDFMLLNVIELQMTDKGYYYLIKEDKNEDSK